MWCEWAQLCIHQVWCLYNFRYKEAGRDQSCSKHSYYECFIEWRAASSLGAISSLDQLQWVRTTRTCSPGHWPSGRRGFLCQVSRLGLLYASRVFFSFFILVASEPVTITEQQVSYEWWEQHKEGDSSRTWAKPSEACICETRSFSSIQAGSSRETWAARDYPSVVLFCLDPTTDTKQIKTFLPCEKLFVTTDYRSCVSCCWFSCAAYSIFRPGHFRQLCSEL